VCRLVFLRGHARERTTGHRDLVGKFGEPLEVIGRQIGQAVAKRVGLDLGQAGRRNVGHAADPSYRFGRRSRHGVALS
jgi:hypothetical protein